jgi:hypothetical protein
MFNRSYKKYSKLKKRVDSFDVVSAHYLYELCLNKKLRFKINFISIFFHIFLLMLSIFSILRSRIKRVNKGYYFVIFDSSLKDQRSLNIQNQIDLNKYINFVRTRSFLTSLKVFFKYPNVVFFQSIFAFSYFINLRIFNENSIEKKYRFISRVKKFQFKCIEKIFYFLGIKKFIMIDDYREIQGFIKICENLKIFSVAYMHSRFSKYRVALGYKAFDKYIVWSNFFKQQLININSKYKNRILINNFNFYNKYKKQMNNNYQKKIKILYFFDMYIDFFSVKFYLDQLINNKNFEIYFKIKNNENPDQRLIKYAKLHNIYIFENKSIKDIVNKIAPQIFMAANSNVLLEATLYNCFPVLIKTKNDYSLDLVKNNSVILLNEKGNICRSILNLVAKSYLKNKIYKKIWGLTNNNNSKLKMIIS